MGEAEKGREMNNKYLFAVIGLRNSGKTCTIKELFKRYLIDLERVRKKLHKINIGIEIEIYPSTSSNHERTPVKLVDIYAQTSSMQERFGKKALQQLKNIIDKYKTNKTKGAKTPVVLLLPFSAIWIKKYKALWVEGITDPLDYAKSKGYEIVPVVIKTSAQTILKRKNGKKIGNLPQQVSKLDDLCKSLKSKYDLYKEIDGEKGAEDRGEMLDKILKGRVE